LDKAKSKSALVRMIELLNAGDVDGAMELVSPEFSGVEVPIGEIIRGKDGVRNEAAGWSGLDGIQRLTNVIEVDEQVVLEGIFEGTHSGKIVLGKETFPATGRRIEFRFCTVGTVRNGLVVGETHYYDMENLRAQLLGN